MLWEMTLDRRALYFLRGAAAAALALGSCKKSGGGSGIGGADDASPLVVGGLPVTCNLTLPVACISRAAAKAARRLTPSRRLCDRETELSAGRLRIPPSPYNGRRNRSSKEHSIRGPSPRVRL